MELKVIRKIFTNQSTVSSLYINGEFFCSILEDIDRGLNDSMSLEEIAKIKVKNETCIPYGKYEIIVSYSNSHKRDLPLLLNVKGFQGIEVHPGNSCNDSSGCLLPGTYDLRTPNFVSNSKKTFELLFDKIKEALKTEKVFIEITKV